MTKVSSRKCEEPTDLSTRARLQTPVKNKPAKRQRKQKYSDEEVGKTRIPIQNPVLKQPSRPLNTSRRKQIVVGNQNIVTEPTGETVVTLHSDVQPGLTLVDQSEMDHGERSLLDDPKFDRIGGKDQNRLVDQSGSVVVQGGGIHIDGHNNMDSVQFGTNDHDGDESNMVILCKVFYFLKFKTFRSFHFWRQCDKREQMFSKTLDVY